MTQRKSTLLEGGGFIPVASDMNVLLMVESNARKCTMRFNARPARLQSLKSLVWI